MRTKGNEERANHFESDRDRRTVQCTMRIVLLLFDWENFLNQLMIILFVHDTENMHIIAIPGCSDMCIRNSTIEHIVITLEHLVCFKGN